MPLDVDTARRAASDVGAPLGLDETEVAAGVHEIVNQNMAAAARMHAVEQGVDLRGVSVLAFGGAGPVHACGVAELLDSTRVIFPVNASVLSAFGTLVSPVRIDLARSMPRRLDAVDPDERDAMLDALRDEGRRVLAAAGSAPNAIEFRYGIDARYAGQGNEVTVWVGEGDSWPAAGAGDDPGDDPGDDAVLAAFESEYRRIFGLTIPDVPVEVVTWRLAASSAAPGVSPEPVAAGAGVARATRSRPVVFGRGLDPVETPVYDRHALGAGARFDGPAVVEERETTAVIRPGWSVEVGPDGSLVATRHAPERAAGPPTLDHTATLPETARGAVA
jgi:N-methylhydantoinase A